MTHKRAFLQFLNFILTKFFNFFFSSRFLKTNFTNILGRFFKDYVDKNIKIEFEKFGFFGIHEYIRKECYYDDFKIRYNKYLFPQKLFVSDLMNLRDYIFFYNLRKTVTKELFEEETYELCYKVISYNKRTINEKVELRKTLSFSILCCKVSLNTSESFFDVYLKQWNSERFYQCEFYQLMITHIWREHLSNSHSIDSIKHVLLTIPGVNLTAWKWINDLELLKEITLCQYSESKIITLFDLLICKDFLKFANRCNLGQMDFDHILTVLNENIRNEYMCKYLRLQIEKLRVFYRIHFEILSSLLPYVISRKITSYFTEYDIMLSVCKVVDFEQFY